MTKAVVKKSAVKKSATTIWDYASTTPLSATKKFSGNGGGTSISGYWMFKKATELWGPCGTGWGYEILEETFQNGAPILDKNGETICYQVLHTIKLMLWYGSSRDNYVTQFGHTPFVMKSNNGPYTDMDVSKKSLTDAIKKALTMLGFSYDIFIGLHDDAAYVSTLKTQAYIEKAEEKDVATDQVQEDIIKYVKDQLEAVKNAVSANEANGIMKVAVRYLQHQKTIPSIKVHADRGEKAIVLAATQMETKLKKPKVEKEKKIVETES